MSDSARSWWEKRRFLYNAGLIVAGMASLTLRAAILELSNCRLEEQNLSPLTLVYAAAAYLAAMGLANLTYSLAPVVEERLHPDHPKQFRIWAFGLFFAVSFVLPFTISLRFLAHC